jgi:methyl-accepting chemotaxis protein
MDEAGAKSLFCVISRYKLLTLFCLLAVFAMGLNVWLIVDLNGEIGKIQELLGSNPGDASGGNLLREIESLKAHKMRMILLLGALVICFGTIIYLFYKRIAAPLHALTGAARRISRGDLSASALVHSKDDFTEVAQVINDMAANFQEVLLLLGTTVGHSQIVLEKMELRLDQEHTANNLDDLRNEILIMKKDLELLSGVVREFEFYQTRFDGHKVVPTIPLADN